LNKKINSLKISAPTDFSWAKDFLFALPKNGESSAADKIEPAASRVSDLKPVVEKLLDTLTDIVKATFGAARIFPTHGQAHTLISSIGMPAELFEVGIDLDLNCEVCGKASLGRGIYSANLSACKARQDCLYIGCRIQSLIAAPITSHSSAQNPIGMLTLFFNEPPEQVEQISKTVLAFAGLLGTLIEHNKLCREDKRIELIAERQTIANEIHDSLAQALVYTRMRTSLLLESIRSRNELMVAKYAHDIDDALENSQKIVRELITEFRCAIDPAGLLHALQILTEQFRQRNGIVLEYINRVDQLELPLEYEIQVSHIVQEALANIAAHSGATHARLIVDLTNNYYVFTIKDNGRGGCTFTPVEGHYGMLIMRERAQRIGGEIKLDSSKGFGTCVQLFFPEPRLNWRTINE
jgi:two-component system nitrate/nitrite sensor histidine kinase NarX